MKKFTKISAVAILMIGSSLSVFAQASATATASATIITPIAITKTVDMNFGNAAVQAGTGGTIVLTPAGTRTVTGGVTLPNVTGTVSSASFNVTGEGTSTYSITLPVAPLTITSGINTMTVSTFTSTPTPTGTLTAGAQTLLVGGTLNVSAAQAPGTYLSGTPFTVTVNYN
ncbi:MAG: DUF4402 domain-containing protein [Bacteroidota bacterium]